MSDLEITQRHGKALSPSGLRPTDAPEWIDKIDNPYLHGIFAPVQTEHESTTLRVWGDIPTDLEGAYFRNGPSSRFEPINRYHWFDGDGMIQGLWLAKGCARFINRWIPTEGRLLEKERHQSIWPGVLGPFDFSLPLAPIKDTANTDVIVLGDKLIALWYESGKPYVLNPRTLQAEDATFLDPLPHRISAHSKVDPNNGDFVFFNYGDKAPYMQYGVMRADGKVHITDIDLPGPRRPHDIGVTKNYSILHDFPVFYDEALFKKTGKRIPLFQPEIPTRFGIIPRFGFNSDIKWFEFDPCYMLHTVNCWQESDRIVMIGCRTNDPTLKPDQRDGKIAAMLSGIKLQANLYRWEINLTTGVTHEGPLDGLNAEFPMINDRWLGKKNRFSYHSIIPYEIPATFEGLVKYNIETGAVVDRYDYPKGVFGSEAPFAPRTNGTDEDDGYLLSFMTHTHDWSSACWIFDARSLNAGPLAKVQLPGRVPAGFHSTFLSGHQWF